MQPVKISAITNDGKEGITFMSFLADETEGTFIWLLMCFKEFSCIDPAIIALDQ